MYFEKRDVFLRRKVSSKEVLMSILFWTISVEYPPRHRFFSGEKKFMMNDALLSHFLTCFSACRLHEKMSIFAHFLWHYRNRSAVFAFHFQSYRLHRKIWNSEFLILPRWMDRSYALWLGKGALSHDPLTTPHRITNAICILITCNYYPNLLRSHSAYFKLKINSRV